MSKQLWFALTAIPKRAIPCLTFSPHADKRRIGSVIHVDHAHIVLARGRAVKPADVLLERAAPGEWHRSDERIERRVIEALADEATGGKQAPGRRRVEGLERIERLRPLTTSEPAMQHDWFET